MKSVDSEAVNLIGATGAIKNNVRKKSALRSGVSISKNYWKLWLEFLESPRTKFTYESVIIIL